MPDTWPQSLLDERVFPHAVDQLQLIETHISWVVLTGPFAYKIKKPAALDFLDFTTLERRRHYCRRELELNRRFARTLYLEVVAVTGSKARPRIGGDGEVIDYAVKMRQFDNRQLADQLAKSGRLSDAIVRRMAKTLAHFHTELPALNDGPDTATTAFEAAALQNFSQLRDYPLAQALRRTLAAREQWTIATLQQHRTLMKHRRRDGFVKDCHGDCHLGNIAILDGEVTLFDCIEFNDSFRVMDTLAEAAFLSMDLCARDLAEQSQRFLNAYLEYRGDYAGLPLLNLYRCYYALVRAKVNLMRTPATAYPTVDAVSHGEFYRYVALSERFTTTAPPALVLMHGLSGSGKSYLAERLATKIQAIRIRSDVERKRLFKLSPEQSGNAVPDLYSREASKRTFERLLMLSHTIADAGFIGIVDATFLTAGSRQPFIRWANEANVPLVILHCDASESTILHRLQHRAATGGDPSDADSAVYRQQKLIAEPLSVEEQQYLVTVDTERADCVSRAVVQLTGRFSRDQG